MFKFTKSQIEEYVGILSPVIIGKIEGLHNV